MSSLIITIIAIAVTALLAVGGVYYGGNLYVSEAAKTQANTLTYQATQIRAASEMFYLDHGEWPTDIAVLYAAGKYLNGKPLPPAGAYALNDQSLSLVSQAIADTLPVLNGDPTTVLNNAVQAGALTQVELDQIKHVLTTPEELTAAALLVQDQLSTASAGTSTTTVTKVKLTDWQWDPSQVTSQEKSYLLISDKISASTCRAVNLASRDTTDIPTSPQAGLVSQCFGPSASGTYSYLFMPKSSDPAKVCDILASAGLTCGSASAPAAPPATATTGYWIWQATASTDNGWNYPTTATLSSQGYSTTCPTGGVIPAPGGGTTYNAADPFTLFSHEEGGYAASYNAMVSKTMTYCIPANQSDVLPARDAIGQDTSLAQSDMDAVAAGDPAGTGMPNLLNQNTANGAWWADQRMALYTIQAGGKQYLIYASAWYYESSVWSGDLNPASAYVTSLAGWTPNIWDAATGIKFGIGDVTGMTTLPAYTWARSPNMVDDSYASPAYDFGTKLTVKLPLNAVNYPSVPTACGFDQPFTFIPGGTSGAIQTWGGIGALTISPAAQAMSAMPSASPAGFMPFSATINGQQYEGWSTYDGTGYTFTDMWVAPGGGQSAYQSGLIPTADWNTAIPSYRHSVNGPADPVPANLDGQAITFSSGMATCTGTVQIGYDLLTTGNPSPYYPGLGSPIPVTVPVNAPDKISGVTNTATGTFYPVTSFDSTAGTITFTAPAQASAGWQTFRLEPITGVHAVTRGSFSLGYTAPSVTYVSRVADFVGHSDYLAVHGNGLTPNSVKVYVDGVLVPTTLVNGALYAVTPNIDSTQSSLPSTMAVVVYDGGGTTLVSTKVSNFTSQYLKMTSTGGVLSVADPAPTCTADVTDNFVGLLSEMLVTQGGVTWPQGTLFGPIGPGAWDVQAGKIAPGFWDPADDYAYGVYGTAGGGGYISNMLYGVTLTPGTPWWTTGSYSFQNVDARWRPFALGDSKYLGNLNRITPTTSAAIGPYIKGTHSWCVPLSFPTRGYSTGVIQYTAYQRNLTAADISSVDYALPPNGPTASGVVQPANASGGYNELGVFYTYWAVGSTTAQPRTMLANLSWTDTTVEKGLYTTPIYSPGSNVDASPNMTVKYTALWFNYVWLSSPSQPGPWTQLPPPTYDFLAPMYTPGLGNGGGGWGPNGYGMPGMLIPLRAVGATIPLSTNPDGSIAWGTVVPRDSAAGVNWRSAEFNDVLAGRIK